LSRRWIDAASPVTETNTNAKSSLRRENVGSDAFVQIGYWRTHGRASASGERI
jgi:hypothetical protein